MVIIGAQGFAKELLATLSWDNACKNLYLFDNINKNIPDVMYNQFKVIKSWEELQKHFNNVSNDFVLGVGGYKARKYCADMAISLGGNLCSVISNKALIGDFGVTLGKGVCILSQVTVTTDVKIGEGTLINKNSIISHDVKIGNYCEISPGARILGRATIGNRCEIGTNAVILPNVNIGNDCKVGAGAVVTKNFEDGKILVGIPAKAINK